MEYVRMDYRFTAILIIMICLLTFFGAPTQ
jgi:hypothetical protein